ncbi:hypothetical protein C5688_13750 [Methylocystis sp. MitZ-2018]|nr:hypothetical protein C5688_13750 [Methylocystis sp. MitZ-2018]
MADYERITPIKLVECPFEVRVDKVLHDRFYDVRDAVAVAQQVKETNRVANVVVTDARTNKLVIKVEG